MKAGCVLAAAALLAALLLCAQADGYHVQAVSSSITKNNKLELLRRERRQVETFDDDEYPTGPTGEAQEETGFWDKVVKVALKLFSRFVEWLNS